MPGSSRVDRATITVDGRRTERAVTTTGAGVAVGVSTGASPRPLREMIAGIGMLRPAIGTAASYQDVERHKAKLTTTGAGAGVAAAKAVVNVAARMYRSLAVLDQPTFGDSAAVPASVRYAT